MCIMHCILVHCPLLCVCVYLTFCLLSLVGWQAGLMKQLKGTMVVRLPLSRSITV